MSKHLSDEQTRVLDEVVKAGVARSPEEAVDQAVRRLHSSATRQKPIHQQVDNIADLFEEKTRNGILSTLRIRGELGSAVALDDIQDGVLAQPEPVAYFPVRLALVDKL